jgi:geranylgeranyl diphosphate synthase, type II
MPAVERTGAWSAWLKQITPTLERTLDQVLPPEDQKPVSVHRAMRYSVFTGGKRIRPALAVLAHRLGGGHGPAGYRLGAALELIHTFSLIHDDLPCMDDDDYRRGRLSCHRKFGEAVAVLAGDALQIQAFEILLALPVDPATRVRVCAAITRAVGTAGVVGGQVVDIESEGKRISPQHLAWMHAHKTGALLQATLVSGGLLAGAPPALLRRLKRFGDEFGLLFQIVDDLLDELGSRKELGRRRGRDRVRGKATYPRILGFEKSRVRLHETIDASLAAIPVSGRQAAIFADLVAVVVGRLPQGWL